MAINLNDNLTINAGKPIDSKYLNTSNQPYTDTTQVNNNVGVSQRYVGLTVLVGTQEYWYATGVTNTDLVLKTADIISSGAITGGTNGLTKSGNNLLLGGVLTGSTTINGGNNSFIVENTSQTSLRNNGNLDISVTGASAILDVNAKTNSQLVLKSQSGSLNGDDFTNAIGLNLDYNSNIFTIVDNRPTPTGIQYLNDLSANFTDRSLVDKAYVDAVASGLDVKAAVLVATTTNIDLTGGTFGGVIDGITLSDGDRVLVKDQTNAVENGIYDYNLATTDFTRSSDFDGTPSNEVTQGAFTVSISGDTNSGFGFVVTTPDPIVVGTTEINWSVFSTPISLVDGTGTTITMIGGSKAVSIELSTNSGLDFDSASAAGRLRINPNFASSGLTLSSGQIQVNASTAAINGSEIEVKFNNSDQLVIDSNDVAVNAANGLSNQSGTVVLGGALTGNTVIDSTNTYGLGFGNNVVASGSSSVAFGNCTQANAENTFASGCYSVSQCSNSHAEGARTLACGETSHAEGYYTIAGGMCSHAEGYRTCALGEAAHSQGSYTEAYGIRSFASGYRSCACGNTSTALGYCSRALGNYSVAIGCYNLAYANTSVAIGSGSCAYGENAIALGCNAESCGDGSVALAGIACASVSAAILGYACDVGAISLGINNIAEGACSVSIGINSISNGPASFAAGRFVNSVGTYSVAMGNGTNVGGNKRVFACGNCSIAITNNLSTQTAGHGANAQRSGIFGGINHNIEATNIGATIVGGNSIKLTGSSYIDNTVVGNLAIFSTPPSGSGSDFVLLWDSNDRKVKIGSVSSGSTGLDSAANGLSIDGDNVVLGGTLTGNTVINTSSFGLTIGCDSSTSGNFATAFGRETQAIGTYGHSQGYYTRACGTASHAQGASTQAIGNCSHSQGFNTRACGTASHSQNVNTRALGFSSHAGGNGYGGGSYILASGCGSFNHSSNNISQTANHGALGDYSAILGGVNHNIESGNTGATIIGGNSIKLTGATYINHTAVDNLAIFSTPTSGSASDPVLVWDSSDKKVKSLASSSLGENNNNYNITGITTATLTSDEYVAIVQTSGGTQTVTLPASPVDGQAFKIKDRGNALTNAITISGNGKNIDGASTASINTDFGALEVVYSSDADEWYTLAFIN